MPFNVSQLLKICLITIFSLLSFFFVAADEPQSSASAGDATPWGEVTLTTKEKTWLAQKHKIRARTANVPPFQFWDNGPQGISVDYMETIAERFGLDVEFHKANTSFADALENIKNHQHLDLILNLKHTVKREKFISFTSDFLFKPYVIFTRIDTNYICGMDDLHGKTVVVQRNYVVHKILKKNFPHINLLVVGNTVEALHALSTGQCDAFIDDLAVGTTSIQRNEIVNIKVAAPTPFENHNQAMGVRDDWPELASIISKALAAMPQEEKNAISKKWLTIQYEYGVSWETVWRWGLGLSAISLLVITIILLANRRLYVARNKLAEEVQQRKIVELELKRMKNEAETANKTKSDFLARMSHEIRTPMNAVLGLGHLLLTTNLDNKQKDYLTKMMTAATSLLALIDDILDFSKIEEEKIELIEDSFKLDDVTDYVLDMMSLKAEDKGVEVVFKDSLDIPSWIKGDALRLRQVLVNLGSNAIKFTSAGKVVISVKLLRSEQDMILLAFSFQDTGIGMTEQQRSALFKPFTQADGYITREFGGTGLGLSISKRLAILMGGDIEVNSEYGKGAEFVFTAWVKQVEKPEQEDIPAVDLRDLHVLIADDNAEAQEILAENLRMMSCRVTAVSSGNEVLDILTSCKQKSQYDVVMLDWKMPGMDGVETARRISEMYPNGDRPKVILVTIYSSQELQKDIKDSKIVDTILAKPIRRSMLTATLAAVLHLSPGRCAPIKDREFNISESIRGARLLIVDDMPINLMVVAGFLKKASISFVEAANGKAAVDILREDTDFDGVLMDLQMPIMDGFKATKRIREQLNLDIPIIAMTAHAMNEEREKCLDAGMNDHVAKPIHPDSLFASLAKFVRVARHRSISHAENNVLLLESTATSSETIEEDHCPAWLTKLTNAPDIDIAQALKRLFGNIHLYEDILNNFVDTHRDTAHKIKDAMDKGNLQEAESLSHAIKGVAFNIGATSVAMNAEALEKSLHSSDNKHLETFSAFSEAHERFISLLDTVLQGYEVNNLVSSDVDFNALFAVVHDLKVCIKNNDLRAVDLLHKLEDYIPNEDMQVLLSQLKQQLMVFDFLQASETLTALKKLYSKLRDQC